MLRIESLSTITNTGNPILDDWIESRVIAARDSFSRRDLKKTTKQYKELTMADSQAEPEQMIKALAQNRASNEARTLLLRIGGNSLAESVSPSNWKIPCSYVE